MTIRNTEKDGTIRDYDAEEVQEIVANRVVGQTPKAIEYEITIAVGDEPEFHTWKIWLPQESNRF